MTNPVRPLRLFITGTDTGVGKTHVTCLIARQMIARGFRVAAYKPVCSGALPPTQSSSVVTPDFVYRWDDIERLKAAIGGDWPDDWICPQRFIAPVAPPVAAKREGKTVDFQRLVDGVQPFHEMDCLLVEGAGGWLSPLTETQSVSDLARRLNDPVLIVARTGLGTINHTLMTVESIRARGLKVAGVVLNEPVALHDDASVCTNADEIEARSGAPVFGTIPHGSDVELHRDGELVTINWQRLASH